MPLYAVSGTVDLSRKGRRLTSYSFYNTARFPNGLYLSVTGGTIVGSVDVE